MREILSPSLAERTSLHLGGRALAELVLERAGDYPLLEERLRQLGGSPFIIGAGTNLLARDGELPVVLIRSAIGTGPEIVSESATRARVRAGAAIPLPRLLGFCSRHGLGGLEGLVGIPGSVGGAVAMNAGSYGCETCRHLVEITAIVDGRVQTFPAGKLQYGYRSLLVDGKKSGFLVLEAIFDLTKTDRNGISKLMHRNICEKKSKQPVTAWSAGCVFKNPAPDKPAGILLDKAGFRGRRLGGMAFSAMHANFLINEGNGSATAAFELMEKARQGVLEQFGIALETEVRIVPCPSR